MAAQFGPTATTHRWARSRAARCACATLVLHDQAERLAWLARYLPELPGSGIVYCLTVADTSAWRPGCGRNGIDAHAYNGPMQAEERERLERALLNNEIKALVATVALGMGYDKPDLGFVVHYQRPGSVIAYYQQVGRAGRAVDDADGILHVRARGRRDRGRTSSAARSRRRRRCRRSSMRSAEVDTATIRYLETQLNIRHSRLETILKLLEVDGAVDRDGSRYVRTLTPWVVRRRAHRAGHRSCARRRSPRCATTSRIDGCLMLFLTAAWTTPTPSRAADA